MKLPNGNPLTPPKSEGSLPATSRTEARSPVAGAAAEVSQANSARAQLAQLNLANRETVLARVAEVISQQSTGTTRLLLDVRGQSLPVNAAIGNTALETGDWVKVMRAGNELQLLGKLAPHPESTIARALAQRLPWQQSLDSGLARALNALTSGLRADPGGPLGTTAPGTSPGPAQPVPAPLRQAIEQLARLLPARQALTTITQPGQTDNPASQVKQWLEQSGLFAESRTARTGDAPPADLKLAIGRIISQLLQHQGQAADSFNRLTPIPTPDLVQSPLQFPAPAMNQAPGFSSEPVSVGQLLRLLAGVLNRITVNQLHSQVLSTRTTADTPAPNNTLVVDLPWLNQNNEPRVIQLRLEDHAANDDASRKDKSRVTEWKLSLAMNLDDAGPMHFEVALGSGQISAQVWAERQTTLKKAQAQLPELRTSLADLGLEVVNLECRRGIPRGAATQLEHRLVDTRA